MMMLSSNINIFDDTTTLSSSLILQQEEVVSLFITALNLVSTPLTVMLMSCLMSTYLEATLVILPCCHGGYVT